MCGTLHVHRKDGPKTITENKLKKGQLRAQNSSLVYMLKWSDIKTSDKDFKIVMRRKQEKS